MFKTLLSLIFFLNVSLCFAQKANVPGDFPDPSIIKFGDYYYCSATSSNWAPGFPVYKSKDMKNWKCVGNIFPVKPDWIVNSYWAPELSVDNGRVYVYYTARKKSGLCVGVASADKPEGPYVDHGPIICEEVGSIDGYAIRDEQNKLYFIWKTDGNSKRQKTPIWIQEMNEERTALLGEKTQLITNDEGWEGNLIEGPAIMKINDYYYMFYSAAGCCGRNCTYKSGIARAKNLLGPWEKDPDNPILIDDENWECQGHGSPIKAGDKYYFLYHGYSTETGVFAGRQGLLREFETTTDNWIRFLPNYIESNSVVKTHKGKTIYFSDKFSGKTLHPSWHYPVMQQPTFKIEKKSLVLNPLGVNNPALFGQKIYSKNYTGITAIYTNKSTAWSGIALIGDENKYQCMLIKDDSVKVLVVSGKEIRVVQKTRIGQSANKMYLKADVSDNHKLNFSYSLDGKSYIRINKDTLDFANLPPWDRAIRIGLISNGSSDEFSVFSEFYLRSN